MIFHVLLDSPAAQASVRRGDRVLEVDGRKASGLDEEALHLLLSGAEDTTVELVLQPFYGSVPRTVQLRRKPHDRVFLDYEAARARPEGIAAGLVNQHGRPVVQSLTPGGPAELFGLAAGDIILEIEGRDTSTLSLFEVEAMLIGPRASYVELLVRSPGGGETVLQIPRLNHLNLLPPAAEQQMPRPQSIPAY